MASDPNQQRSMGVVVKRVLKRMGADQDTQDRASGRIQEIIEAIGEEEIESGTACVPWKDGGESSLAAAISGGLIQMLRLGHDNQIRGEIWLIRAQPDKIVAGPLDAALNDYSNHEAMRRQAMATDKFIQDSKDAKCMSQKLLGKAATTYEEPKVPEHLQFGR